MTEYSLPGGRYRREIRKNPRQPPVLTFVEDRGEAKLYWPKLGTVWAGSLPLESAADGAARLLSLYSVSVVTGGRVVGRATWRLNLSAPDGRLRRALWVDRANGMLLKCEEYRLDGSLARRERFIALDPASPDPSLFRLQVPTGTLVSPLTAPRGAADPSAHFPRWIPDGFLALSLSADGSALTVGYGDGVAEFTLRDAPAGAEPVEDAGRTLRLKDGTRATLMFDKECPRLSFSIGGRRYSITGDITEDEMVRMADSLAEPAR